MIRNSHPERVTETNTIISSVARVLEKESFQAEVSSMTDSRLIAHLRGQLEDFRSVATEVTSEMVRDPNILLRSTFEMVERRLTDVDPSVDALEDFLRFSRRDWRNNKEWIGPEWNNLYGRLLEQVEELSSDKASFIILTMRSQVADLLTTLSRPEQTVENIFDQVQTLLEKLGMEEAYSANQSSDLLRQKYRMILSSVTCEQCGYTEPDPHVSEWICPACGTSYDLMALQSLSNTMSLQKLVMLSILNQRNIVRSRGDIAFVKDLFTPRNEVIQRFHQFVSGDRPFLLLTGQAGIGKTWTAVDLGRTYFENQGLVFFFSLRYGFETLFGQTFGGNYNVGVEALKQVLPQLKQPLMLILDGWDEVTNVNDKQLLMGNFLLMHARSWPNIRVILTSRSFDWYNDRTIGFDSRQEFDRYSQTPVHLDRFKSNQLRLAAQQYQLPEPKLFHPLLQDLISFPIWLRLVSEYAKEEQVNQYNPSVKLLTKFFCRMGLEIPPGRDLQTIRNYELFGQVITQLVHLGIPLNGAEASQDEQGRLQRLWESWMPEMRHWLRTLPEGQLATVEQRNYIYQLQSVGVLDGVVKDRKFQITLTHPIFGYLGLAVHHSWVFGSASNEEQTSFAQLMTSLPPADKQMVEELAFQYDPTAHQPLTVPGPIVDQEPSPQKEIGLTDLRNALAELVEISGNNYSILVLKLAQRLAVNPEKVVELVEQFILKQKIRARIDDRGTWSSDDDLVILQPNWDIENEEWENVQEGIEEAYSDYTDAMKMFIERLNLPSDARDAREMLSRTYQHYKEAMAEYENWFEHLRTLSFWSDLQDRLSHVREQHQQIYDRVQDTHEKLDQQYQEKENEFDESKEEIKETRWEEIQDKLQRFQQRVSQELDELRTLLDSQDKSTSGVAEVEQKLTQVENHLEQWVDALERVDVNAYSSLKPTMAVKQQKRIVERRKKTIKEFWDRLGEHKDQSEHERKKEELLRRVKELKGEKTNESLREALELLTELLSLEMTNAERSNIKAQQIELTESLDNLNTEDYHGIPVASGDCKALQELEELIGKPIPHYDTSDENKRRGRQEVAWDDFGFETKDNRVVILGLHKQKLTHLPSSVTNMTKLRKLFLGNNSISELPASLCQLEELVHLTLNDNDLSEYPSCLGGLRFLDKLDLSYNSLKVIPPTIENLAYLEHLDISYNEVETLPDSFGELVELEKLELTENRIERLPTSFCRLRNLEELGLGYNQLEELPTDFGNLQKLKILELRSNELGELPASFVELTNLSYLDLNDNSLSTLPDDFGDLGNLKTLWLNNNKLNELPSSVSHLLNLEYLYLRENHLTGLPDSIGELEKLKELMLYGNELEELPLSVGDLSSLESLNLSNNKLTNLPESVGKLRSLKDLELKNNSLRNLPDSLAKLSNLKNLEIRGNGLHSLPNPAKKLEEGGCRVQF